MGNTFEIQTTQNVGLAIEVASLGDRIVAYIIDTIIKMAYLFFVWVIGIFGLVSTGLVDGGVGYIYLIMILIFVPYLFYTLFFEIIYNGQTPGKKAVDIQVVMGDGGEVPIRSYFLRWLLRIVDFQIMSGLVALICVAVSDKSQRIGDMVAGTVVVKNRKKYKVGSTVFQEFKDEYEPVYLAAKSLQPSEVALIKEVLDGKMLDRNNIHIEALAGKLSAHLDIPLSVHPRKFLRTLLRDYSYLRQ